MTFEQWWKETTKYGKDSFSEYAIQDEIKWFAEKAWDAALTNTVSMNGCNCNIYGYSKSTGGCPVHGIITA